MLANSNCHSTITIFLWNNAMCAYLSTDRWELGEENTHSLRWENMSGNNNVKQTINLSSILYVLIRACFFLVELQTYISAAHSSIKTKLYTHIRNYLLTCSMCTLWLACMQFIYVCTNHCSRKSWSSCHPILSTHSHETSVTIQNVIRNSHQICRSNLV